MPGKEVPNSDQTAALLAWFENHGVDHPWVGTRDPWAIWVSEVMLQQTTVGAVGPRYRRWMERYPTPEDLARTDEQEILRDWEGLGYYNRARNLALAAGEITARFGGRIPRGYGNLRSLPGVGDYIASALSSFAFGERRAAIDANGRRIAQRLLGIQGWDKTIENRFRKAVESRMPEENPGLLNAAIMQFGQLVCLPRTPRCGECPLQAGCMAKSNGTQNEIPLRKKKETVTLHTRLAILVDGGKVLVTQRRDGIARGMWVFPSAAEIDGLETDWVPADELPIRIHTYTKYREFLEPRMFYPKKRGLPNLQVPQGGEWTDFDDLPGLPMPTAYRKIAAQLPGCSSYSQ